MKKTLFIENRRNFQTKILAKTKHIWAGVSTSYKANTRENVKKWELNISIQRLIKVNKMNAKKNGWALFLMASDKWANDQYQDYDAHLSIMIINVKGD